MKIANYNQYPLSTCSVLVFHNSPVKSMCYPHCSDEETEGCASIRLGRTSLPICSRGRSIEEEVI